jgi:hypothetical protein
MMNERHRKVSAAGFAKMTHWVRSLDVTRLTPSEGIRLFEVFVRIESLAAGTYTVDQALQEEGQLPAQPTQTIADLLPGIDPSLEHELADLLLRIGDAAKPPDEPGNPLG